MKIHRRPKPQREERGSVIVEAALALPIFFIFVLGTIEIGFGIRSYLSVSRALYIAAHRMASVSAIDDWRSGNGVASEDVCLEIAGDTFVQELINAGGLVSSAKSDPNLSAGSTFVLAGRPYDYNGNRYPAPRAYELQTQYRYKCIICGVTGKNITFRLSTIAVLETARGCDYRSRPSGAAAGYFPGLSPDQRVASVPESALH
jgi:hypothetical protein